MLLAAAMQSTINIAIVISLVNVIAVVMGIAVIVFTAILLLLLIIIIIITTIIFIIITITITITSTIIIIVLIPGFIDTTATVANARVRVTVPKKSLQCLIMSTTATDPDYAVYIAASKSSCC